MLKQKTFLKQFNQSTTARESKVLSTEPNSSKNETFKAFQN